AAAGLPMVSKAKVQIAGLHLPSGQIEGGAAGAFERAIGVALLKLDFVARRGAAKRGTPLVDFAKLDLPDAARAALAAADDSGDDRDDGDPDDEDDRLARVRRRFERAIPDAAERRAALELLAYAIEDAHDERPSGWYLRDHGGGLTLFAGRIAACSVERG